MIQHFKIQLPPFKRGFHIIDNHILNALPEIPETAVLQIFIQHTSAAITVNENADSTVRMDFETVFNKLVPEGMSYYKHDMEGDDDMPAHIKAALIGNSVSIPISNGKLNLGTWQGIYLCEFRNHAQGRNLIITILS